ncbi:MAG: FAD-dependent oxidoreductase [Armatimonadetes bacterium]|nr:FAD-dependent oxidoreductase [Armatimonadota bacterium]
MSNKIYDVIVCGGGTAGTAAALAASRLGATTLVIEQFGSLGGTQSNGWVTPMMPNYLGEFKLNRGLNLDIIDAQSLSQPVEDGEPHADVWYDPVMLGYVLDELAEAAGVECLFCATLLDARVIDGQIVAVEVLSRGSRFWIEGKAFIDCTGDAELSKLAGAELMGGNEDGVHQPMTLRFKMGNIDLGKARLEFKHWRLVNEYHLETGFGEAKESPMKDWVFEAIDLGILQHDDLGYFQIFTMNGCPGEMAFNSPRVAHLDPLDPFDFSRAHQIGRAKIFRIAKFMRAYFPGFENAFVSGIAPMMGIRESRRVVGEYILTGDDHQNCQKFEDTIARNRYPVDIHLKVGLDYRRFPPGEFHDIPYRSLVVKGLKNLWVAGRCLSADFVAQSAVRIQPVCRAMGEAAGAAAALCSKANVSAKDLPYADLALHLDLSLPNPAPNHL